MKFREDSLNNFLVIERTRFCDRVQALWFLRSARHLILIDTYMKFRKDSLNGFQVIERTRFCDSKKNNSKSINARVIVLALYRSSNVD